MLRLSLSIMENGSAENSYVARERALTFLNWNTKPRFSEETAKLGINSVPFPRKSVLGLNAMDALLNMPWVFVPWNSSQARQYSWKLAFALDTGGLPGNGGQDSLNGDNSGIGQTRLGRLVSAGGRQLLEKVNSARKNFPMKIFLVLLGFYTANALATILGQTGDWDVLVAGIVVAAIEGIGKLMYTKPPSLLIGRFQSLVVMINYWKAGVCLGLFVDAFKLGS